jgi:hypothetical protein
MRSFVPSGGRFVLAAHFVVLGCFVAVALCYWAVGDTKYFNVTTFYLTIGLIAVLGASAMVAHIRTIHVLDMLLIGLYLFVLLRLVHFLLSPSTVVLPVQELAIGEINSAVQQLVQMVAAFVVGLCIVNVRRTKKSGIVARSFPTKAVCCLFVVFFIVTIIETIIYSDLASSIYTLRLLEKSEIPVVLKIILTIVSADTFLFLIVFLYINKSPGERGSWKSLVTAAMTFLCVLAFIYSGSFTGSRGGGLRIMLYAIGICLVVLPYSKRAIARAGGIAVIAVVTNVALIPLAHQSRDILASGDITVSEEVAAETPPDSAIRIANRFGYLDYLVVTLTRSPDAACAARYLVWPYYAKNVVNFVAPGDPFPDARLNSSNAFGICYRGMTEETMPHYHSEVWTLPGLAKIMFPGFEIPVCFSLGLLLGLLSRWLRKLQGPYGTVIYAFWVYAFPFTIFFTMGVDHTVNTYITSYLRLAVALLVLMIASRLPGVPWRPRRIDPTRRPSLESSAAR